MMGFIQKYKLAIIGVIIGAIAGYFYWKYVGCLTGTCPLKSSPINMTIIGGIMGGLILDLFRKTKPSKE